MSKIETTQSSFLLRYGATLIVFTELLMFCTIIVLYSTEGAYIPTFIMLFLSPLLGSIIANKISRKLKKVIFNESIDKYFLITNIVIYILIYLFNFRVNVIMIAIYSVGAILGFFKAKKNINEIKEKMEIEQDDNCAKGENIKVKEFKLGKFNGESVREFLKANNLKEENYLLAQIIPTVKEYLIYGYFSFSNYNQYIIYFDDEKMYFFELGKLSSKVIKNGFVIKFEDLRVQKLKKGLISYKIKIKFKDDSIANIQIVKKVAKLFLQKQYSEKLFNKLLELKNKE